MKHPLILGLATWIVTFAILFGALYGFLVWSDKPGPDNDALTSVLAWALLILPQVLSSILGSAVASRRSASAPNLVRASTIFAASTSAVTVFGSVVWWILISGDRPSGPDLLGWFAVIVVIALAIDCTLAALGGYVVGRETQKRRRRDRPSG